MEKIIIEIIGAIAGVSVLFSYSFSNKRTLRLINIVASIIFILYGFLLAKSSNWSNGWVTIGLNIFGIFLHIYKLKEESKIERRKKRRKENEDDEN